MQEDAALQGDVRTSALVNISGQVRYIDFEASQGFGVLSLGSKGQAERITKTLWGREGASA